MQEINILLAFMVCTILQAIISHIISMYDLYENNELKKKKISIMKNKIKGVE